MADILDAIVGGALALLGAFVAGSFALRSTQRQLLHQRQAGMDAARLAAHSALLGEGHQVRAALMAWHRTVQRGREGAAEAGVTADHARTAWLRQRSAAELLASPDARTAIRRLDTALQDLHLRIYAAHRDGCGSGLPSWGDLDDGLEGALDGYTRAASRELDPRQR